MRKKKHADERINACEEYLIKKPLELGRDLSGLFPEDNPLLLEIGCGKGDFCAALSAKLPEFNIIAIEKIPDVMMFALEKAKRTADERPDNLRFIIGDASLLGEWFAEGTFSRIYINFCDPWLKKRYHKRRLTAPSFLEKYRRLLIPHGELHFKTDNDELFEWSVEQFESERLEFTFLTRDLHSSELNSENIVTEYERNFSSKGFTIKSAHLRF